MKILQLIFVVGIGLFIGSFAIAQEKKNAVKFDEFSHIPSEISDILTDRANRFVRQILKEPKTSKAVVIYYNQRKGAYPLDKGEDWAHYAQGVSVNGYNIPKQQIVVINGGYREYATVEFWVVPQKSEMPKPTPTLNDGEIVICPEIDVAGDGFRRDRNLPLNFSVVVKGTKPNSKLDFEWTVSAGKIIAGQGTNQIKVDLSQTAAKRITASAQLKGLNPECDNRDFRTTEVGFFPYKVDEFYYAPYSETSARIDSLLRYLDYDPTVTAHIIIYGRREGNLREIARTISILRKTILDYKRFDESKVKIVEGGFRESGMIEFYIIPSGVKPPEPTPTLDRKFVVLKKQPTKRKQ